MSCYLVTGGAGFIGSHLCDALIKKHTVYVLDNLSTGCRENLPKGVEFIQGDVRDETLVKDLMSKVDGCFHLAAIVSVPLCNENLYAAHQINLTGMMNVLENAHRVSTSTKHIPIVFASSCAVYGDVTELPHCESSATHPISFYAATKLFAEYNGRFVNQQYQLPFTALRLFNVYGPRQQLDNPYSGVIPIFIKHLLRNEHCTIYGDGTASRDFISVHDVIKFFIRAMETSTNTMRVFNVCTGKSTAIKTIADLLSRYLEKEMIIDYLPHNVGDILHSRGNPKLAQKELGIVAEQSIENGLKALVRSWLSHSNQTE